MQYGAILDHACSKLLQVVEAESLQQTSVIFTSKCEIDYHQCASTWQHFPALEVTSTQA